MKKIISILCISSLLFNLTACQENKIKIAENQPFMTELEYKEIFQNEINSKIEVQRNIKEDFIELYDLPEDMESTIYNKMLVVLKDLNKNIGYEIPYYLHENFKFLMDNLIQNGKLNIKLSTGNGYYYAELDTTFKKNPELDAMKTPANYLGIRGAFGYDENGQESVDIDYLETLVKAINDYRLSIKKDPVPDKIEQINYLENIEENNYDDVLNRLDIEKVDVISTQSELENIYETFKPEEKEADIDRTLRKLYYDAEEFNNVAGISKDSEPIIPHINALFDVKEQSDLSGYSIYNWGSSIKDNQDSTINAKIMFVFKYDVDTKDYKLVTYYPVQITNNINIDHDNKVFPSNFIKNQIKVKTEELHRALANKSISTLTSGNLIFPQDLGIYLLYYRNTIYLLNSEMGVSEIVLRDNNSYIAKIWYLTTETIKETNTSGARFLREYLVRFTIEDGDCYISDMILTNLSCLKLPKLIPDNGSLLKLINIQSIKSGVSDDLKEIIKGELNKFQSGLTNKIPYDLLRDDGTIKSDPKTGIEAWGWISRINPDNTILPQKERERLLYLLNGTLLRNGRNTKCNVYIRPGEWRWSTNRQVALQVHILYDWGKSKPVEIISYDMYFSKLLDKWYIDEMTETNLNEYLPEQRNIALTTMNLKENQ